MRRLIVIAAVSTFGLGFGSHHAHADACNPATTPSVQTFDVPAGDGTFRCTTMSIPSGVTIKFNRNATNTPVTFEITNTVTIAGTIDVSGAAAGAPVAGTVFRNGGRGGPGGFDGGAGANGTVSTTGGAGLGPGGGGGGDIRGAGGGGGYTLPGANAYWTPSPNTGTLGGGGGAYGGSSALPLIGGSGGGGGGAGWLGYTGGGGGGGGGALLIFLTSPTGTITFSGSAAILANGGNATCCGNYTGSYGGGGGGSGGTVRLVARTVSGPATINVAGGTGNSAYYSNGGTGSVGRVRVEGTITSTFTFTSSPAGVAISMTDLVGTETLSATPTLAIAQVAGVNAPASPSGSLATPDILLPATTPASVTVNLQASQVPPGTTVTLVVKGQSGTASTPVTTTLAGTLTNSTASANVTIPLNQPAIITATLTFTRTADAGGGPIYVRGEPVERVRLAARWGGTTEVTYITRSGREIVIAAAR